MCCSAVGWCGLTPAHCRVDSCQSGPCCQNDTCSGPELRCGDGFCSPTEDCTTCPAVHFVVSSSARRKDFALCRPVVTYCLFERSGLLLPADMLSIPLPRTADCVRRSLCQVCVETAFVRRRSRASPVLKTVWNCYLSSAATPTHPAHAMAFLGDAVVVGVGVARLRTTVVCSRV
jgi:chitin recognition protein